MTEKYILYIDEQAIAIKFNHRDYKMTIGSYARFRETIEQVITNYFRDTVPRIQWPQRNKIKYVFGITLKNFSDGIKQLKDHGFMLESVTSLRRLIR